MERVPIYLFEKQTGETEFIPRVESEVSWGRYIKRKYHKPGVRILRNLVSSISHLLITSSSSSINEDDESIRGNCVLEGCKDFLKTTPRSRNKYLHLQLFYWYRMPDYLVYLYESPISNNKDIAEESVRLFLFPNIGSFPVHIQHLFGSIVFRFCELLRDHTTTTSGRLLYYSCRQTYGSLLRTLPPANTNFKRGFFSFPAMVIHMFYPFTNELTKQLLVNMKLIRQSCFCRVPSELKSRFDSDIYEFSIFTLHMCSKIKDHMMKLQDPSIDFTPSASNMNWILKEWYSSKEPELFYGDFSELLNNVDLGLTYMDDGIEYTRCTECEFNHGWSYYLPILKELDLMSKLYQTAEKNLASCLISHRDSINKLIMKLKRGGDHQWLLRHKNLISKESRGHLIKMMFPNQVKNGCELQKMNSIIIDRSKLLVDSFEHVGLANPILLRNGIIPRLKNEEAFEAGPEVFREWLVLLCQHLFAPQSSLFLSCPYDHQRFYPNPAKLDSQQLQYYGFCGRVIALALMHDVQIGIGFDRLFFLQLAGGSKLTLEDIRNADPYMYKSCRDILEMDTKLINSDCLGLTFVWETEEKDECGSRKTVELCPGGNTMVVSSMNREEYIKLVIQHCFVKSIEEKVKLFIQGFDDVLTRKCRKMFFESIELEDLDDMLIEKAICEEDRNSNEVVGDSSITPFQKIIRTTLPLSSRTSFHLHPLTCKQQSGGFRIY